MSQVKKVCNSGRRWVITINNYTEEELDILSGIQCSYLLYGMEEAPSTGTPHLHAYIVFENSQRFSFLKNKLPRARIELARKGHEECINYVTKDDPNPFEKGERPVTKKKISIKPKKILESDLINGQKKLATKRLLHGMELEKEMFKEILEKRLEKPEIVYVYGGTGTGKTYFALEDSLKKYGYNGVATIRFDKNGFAHCNDPQKDCLVWMEFRPSCLDAASFLELTDGYGCHLNVKHGSMFIRPRCIYICSILHPSEIYKEEINQQFQRRITTFVNKDEDPWISDDETEVE